MTESYFYEGWLPNDDDDFSETFAGVAGDMAEATQQRLAEPAARPQRLWEAYGLTTTSIGIWMASTSEYLGMNGMIAPLRVRTIPKMQVNGLSTDYIVRDRADKSPGRVLLKLWNK